MSVFWGSFLLGGYWAARDTAADIWPPPLPSTGLPDSGSNPYDHGDFNAVQLVAGPYFGDDKTLFDQKMQWFKDRGVKVMLEIGLTTLYRLPNTSGGANYGSVPGYDFGGPGGTALNLPAFQNIIAAYVAAGIDLGAWHADGTLIGTYLFDDVSFANVWGTGTRGWNVAYSGYTAATDTTHYGVAGFQRTDTDNSLFTTGYGIPGNALDEAASYIHAVPGWENIPNWHRAAATTLPPLQGGYQHVAGPFNLFGGVPSTSAAQYRHMLPLYSTNQWHTTKWWVEWQLLASDYHGFDRSSAMWGLAFQHGGWPNNDGGTYTPGTRPSSGLTPITSSVDLPSGYPTMSTWATGSNQGGTYMRPAEIVEFRALIDGLETNYGPGDQGHRYMNFRLDLDVPYATGDGDWYDRLNTNLVSTFGATTGAANYAAWHAALKDASDTYLNPPVDVSGAHTAVALDVFVRPNASGEIIITTEAVAQSPMINAIEIQTYDRSVTLDLLDSTPAPFAFDKITNAGVQETFLDLLTSSPAPFMFTGVSGDVGSIILPLIDHLPTVYSLEIEEVGVTVSDEIIGPLWVDIVDPGDSAATPSSASVGRSSSFAVTENDTLPLLTFYLRNGHDEILDLSAATGIDPTTITFTLRSQDNSTVKVDEATCTFDTATHLCTYAWLAGDTDTSGEYDGEIEVTVTGGRKFTAPSPPIQKMRITIGGELS